MSDIAPQTKRPETVDDLRYKHRLTPDRIMDCPNFNGDRDIARWWGNVLATAMEVPTLMVSENGDIIRPRLDDEKQGVLIDDQEKYDRGRALYQKWLSDGVYPDWTHMWSDYLFYEGIEEPKRPEATDE